MLPKECYDRIRFTLGDASGVVCFKSFDIVDAPQCASMAQALRTYLVGRPLSDINLDYLRSLTCRGNGECMRAVIYAVREYQQVFA